MVKRPLKFLADRMLGKLARYLLMLGIDTVYFTQTDRSELIAAAKEEGRVVLSRDTTLRDSWDSSDSRGFVFVKADAAEDQLRQVIDHFEIALDKVQLFTRCLKCNRNLIKRTPEEVKPFVPPYILTTHREFSSCPQCEKVYWRGTHQKKMVERISALLKKARKDA